MRDDVAAHPPPTQAPVAPPRQQPLPLHPVEPEGFARMASSAGNALALAQLQRLAEEPQRVGAAPLYLWGQQGVGKTRWLRAAADAVARAGGHAPLLTPQQLRTAAHAEAAQALDAAAPDVPVLLLVDDVQQLDDVAQQHAFAWLVEAQTRGVPWVAAGDRPPIDLPLRDDLRTRLGWGAVHGLQPLDDAELAAELRREAARRGFELGDDLVEWVMRREQRSAPHLMRLLQRLDRFALAEQRRVTLPLLRRMLEDEQGHAHAGATAGQNAE